MFLKTSKDSLGFQKNMIRLDLSQESIRFI